jgi:hypothetical protein
MFKYDKYITHSLSITQYINKTYQHKNKCLLLTARFQKVFDLLLLDLSILDNKSANPCVHVFRPRHCCGD